MLALSRKKNEALVIDNKIEVTILEIKGDQVKVGISAPKDIKIIRNELRHAQETNLDSSKAVSKDALDALLTLKKDQ